MSSTNIILEFPYSEDFKTGYLNTNSEPRRIVSLIGKDGSRSSTSYARYLMSCHLGRYLEKSEQVDHIDNNPLNDVIDNLQLLSHGENNLKQNSFYNIERCYMTLNCPICSKDFTRDCRNIKTKIKRGKQPTCSRSCGGKMSHIIKNKP